MDKSEKVLVTGAGDQPSLPAYDSSDDAGHAPIDNSPPLGFWTRMGCTPESFKRRTLADKHNQLNQTLKGRHLHMIAIGGSIGAGLFVGSGSALFRGGPATLVIDFSLIGVVSMILCIRWKVLYSRTDR